jgi:hypothetical protein
VGGGAQKVEKSDGSPGVGKLLMGPLSHHSFCPFDLAEKCSWECAKGKGYWEMAKKARKNFLDEFWDEIWGKIYRKLWEIKM